MPRCAPIALKDRLGRRMARVLGLDAHFIIQRPGGDHLEPSVLDADGVQSCASARYAGRHLSDAAGTRIDGAEDAVGVVDIILGHERGTDRGPEAGVRVPHANSMVADLTSSDVLVMAGAVR